MAWAQAKSTRITPTCVGNTQRKKKQAFPAQDHPHLRGEYFFKSSRAAGRAGSPPLAWGIPALLQTRIKRHGITPTCVGNTHVVGTVAILEGDHPHLRGEYSEGKMLQMTIKGSPPLAWGIRRRTLSMTFWKRITPTCVGNTVLQAENSRNRRDHPHLRGEYGDVKFLLLAPLGSPPLAWGIHKHKTKLVHSKRITPTCVGNTRDYVAKTDLGEDHPHLRGEYLPSTSAQSHL